MQTLLFNQSPFVYQLGNGKRFPEEFYTNGYAVLENIEKPEHALEVLQTTLASIDTEKLPLFARFLSRMQLGKADVIPVCDDVVATSFQVLHFDMGQPIIANTPQDMYLITALYREKNKRETSAKTRIVRLKGFFKDKKWGGEKQIEKRLISYAQKYGDGWFKPTKVNTQRLACFARVLDAVCGTSELSDYIDKTMAQWFKDEEILDLDESKKNEHEFYAKKGINLSDFEEYIHLKPGQLLFFDNTRIVHGRFGQRKRGEIYQFMFGVKEAIPKDVDAFRKHLIRELTT